MTTISDQAAAMRAAHAKAALPQPPSFPPSGKDSRGIKDLVPGTYFVSGIDTDAGKTAATGFIARELLALGRKTITMKLVQTGEEYAQQSVLKDHPLSVDIRVHRRIMGCGFPEDAAGLSAPQAFSFPGSPHLASKIDARAIEFARIEHSLAVLESRYDYVLIEGAGGLMVPLTRKLLTIDYAAQHHWPVIFVANAKLGSINHALLSLEALASRSMPLAVFAFNLYDAWQTPAVIVEDTQAFLREYVEKNAPQALWLDVPILDI